MEMEKQILLVVSFIVIGGVIAIFNIGKASMDKAQAVIVAEKFCSQARLASKTGGEVGIPPVPPSCKLSYNSSTKEALLECNGEVVWRKVC